MASIGGLFWFYKATTPSSSYQLDDPGEEASVALHRTYLTYLAQHAEESEFHQHVIGPRAYWEEFSRRHDARFSEEPDRWLQLTVPSSELSSPTQLDSVILAIEGLVQAWESQTSSWEDFRLAFDAACSRSWLREFQQILPSKLSPGPHRLTGPVQFVKGLLATWNLHEEDAIPLLGFERHDETYVYSLLSGHIRLVGRDAKDRIALLLHIRMTLSALFDDEEVENDWLREPHAMLGDQMPITLLLEGGMENLLLLNEYVDTVAGT